LRTSPETAPLTAELLSRLLPIVGEINAVLDPAQLLPTIARQLTRIKLSEGLCGAAARTRETILVPDVRSDPRYLNWLPDTLSALVVPLDVTFVVVKVL
jgi:putative methionine-R-sulfoxide reductase with GAF domain